MNPQKLSKRLAKDLGAVRQKKINRLKAKISAGKYHVTAEDLAKAIFLAQ
jgi:anti-sigma28 factor (negative regulator of flagellin synthesis)